MIKQNVIWKLLATLQLSRKCSETDTTIRYTQDGLCFVSVLTTAQPALSFVPLGIAACFALPGVAARFALRAG